MAALLPARSKLLALTETLLSPRPSPDPAHSSTALALKALGWAAGTLPGVAYLPTSLAYPRELPPGTARLATEIVLGALGFVNFRITYMAIVVQNLVENVIHTLDAAEDTDTDKHALAKKIAQLTLSTLMGSAAFFPWAVVAVKYNPTSHLGYLSTPDALEVIYSSWLTTDKLFRPTTALHRDLLASVDSALTALMQGRGPTWDADTTPEEWIDTLLAHQSAPPTTPKAQEITATVLGLAITAGLLYFYFASARDGVAELSSNRALPIAAGLFTCFCNLALLQLFLITPVREGMTGLLSCRSPTTGRETYIGERLSPRTARAIRWTSGILSLPSAVPIVNVAQTYFSPEAFPPMALALGLSNIFMTYKVTRILGDLAQQKYITLRGTPEQKELLERYTRVSRFRDFLAASSPTSTHRFLTALPPTPRITALLTRHGATP